MRESLNIPVRVSLRTTLTVVACLAGFQSQAWAQQNRLPASDEPGRIERRFPSPADMLRGETPTDMSTPPGSGNHPVPTVRKDNTPQIIQDGNDIILLPSGKEEEKK